MCGEVAAACVDHPCTKLSKWSAPVDHLPVGGGRALDHGFSLATMAEPVASQVRPHNRPNSSRLSAVST